MVENLADDDGVFDAGDDLHGATAGLAGFDVDVEHALHVLCPRHHGTALHVDPLFGGIARFLNNEQNRATLKRQAA